MQKTLNYWLDFFFPRDGLGGADIHNYITPSEIAGYFSFNKKVVCDLEILEVWVAASYQEELLQDLLHRAKFRGELLIVDDLVKLVLAKYSKRLQSLPGLVVTHIPPDPRRWLERGYHLPELLASKIAREAGLVHLNLVKKTKHTKSQVELAKKDREKSLEGCFTAKSGVVQPVDNLLIIDDITTTGATFRESVRALRRRFPKTRVLGLVVAG
jgi:ComF family protein